jgi:hypothetical protein
MASMREARQYREDPIPWRTNTISRKRRAAVLSARCNFGPAGPSRPEVLAFLSARARARGVSLNDLVSALLKQDIEMIEAAE